MKQDQYPGNVQRNTLSNHDVRAPKEVIVEKQVVTNNIIKMAEPSSAKSARMVETAKPEKIIEKQVITNNIIKMAEPSSVKSARIVETSRPEKVIEKHVETKVEKYINQPIINKVEKHEHVTQKIETHEHVTQNVQNHITNPVIKETKEINNIKTNVEKIIETRNVGGSASKGSTTSTTTTETSRTSSSRGNALENFLKKNPEPTRTERRGTVRFPRNNK